MVRKHKRGEVADQDELFYETPFSGGWRYRKSPVTCPHCRAVMPYWTVYGEPHMEVNFDAVGSGVVVSYRTVTVYVIRCSQCRQKFNAPDWIVAHLKGGSNGT